MNLAMHLISGQKAEDSALATLMAAGLQMVARNYRCPQGELDLVMADDDTLVIVEVRFRRERGFGDAAASVNARKQQKLLHATQHFLQRDAGYRRRPLRFDVVAVTEAADGTLQIDWIKDAFRAD